MNAVRSPCCFARQLITASFSQPFAAISCSMPRCTSRRIASVLGGRSGVVAATQVDLRQHLVGEQHHQSREAGHAAASLIARRQRPRRHRLQWNPALS